MEVAVFIRGGNPGLMRFAFDLARKRPKRHLTLVTKSNAQRHGMVLWDSIFQEFEAAYPDVTTDRMLVDAMTTRMAPAPRDHRCGRSRRTSTPTSFPIWRRPSPGSLGMGATANLNPERKYPSMFEPIHGSAFDIMGKGIANPIGTFWSAVLMLEHLGENESAALLMRAIEKVTAGGKFPAARFRGEKRTPER